MVAVGTQLGPYEILALLGAGGMGEVYRARDTRLDRDVAVKVLPEQFAQDPDHVARFQREAKAVAALSHPNILALHDYGTDRGFAFAVMELLEGETVRDRVARSAVPWRKAMELGTAIADGLATAHAKSIIHRDLKPENLFLTSDGRVKILDFGLAWVDARLSTPAATGIYVPARTDPGTIMGTVGYMSPEQVQGQAVDGRSDIFSLGCVLYEMVSGQRAFARASGAETMAAILKEDVPEFSDSGKNIPLEVDRAIRHCLEKKPEERFQSARDLAFALRTISSGSDLGKSPQSAGPRYKTAPARRPRMIDSLAVLPLANAQVDPMAEYLSDGITESIINSLAQVPKLRVMARSIVFRYKGKQVDPQEVGRDLNVRAVVTGKVFQVADRLVIAAELVDVADGSQLWGEQYNRKPADIFAVQEEISREIIEKLRLRLSGEQKKRLAKRNTEDPEAYQLYLKGRYYWNKRSAEGLKKAVECFQQGIDKDPNYAQAYAGMADCYSSLGTYSVLAPRDTFPKAKAAALKALALDDSLAEAHLALAFVLHLFEWDWSDAEKKFKRALQLNPANAETHHWYAWYLMRVGQVKEGLAEMKLAQEMDVLSLPINSSLGTAFFYARDYDRAVEQLLKALEMDPNFAEAHRALGETYQARAQYDDAIAEYQRARTLSGGSAPIAAHLGNVYAAAGKKGDARKLLAELQKLGKRTYVSAYDMASIHVGFGDREQAFEWLEMAYGERSYLLAEIKNDPRMDSLRSDPRFIDLLRRIGLQP